MGMNTTQGTRDKGQGTREGLRLYRRCKTCVVHVPRARHMPYRVHRVMGGIVNERSLYRLARSGLVASERREDGAHLVCMLSLCAHLIAASEPGFWNAERTAAYLAAR